MPWPHGGLGPGSGREPTPGREQVHKSPRGDWWSGVHARAQVGVFRAHAAADCPALALLGSLPGAFPWVH